MRPIFSKLHLLFGVPKCVACGEFLHGDLPLCPDCLEKFAEAKARTVPCCGKPISLCTCPPTALDRGAVHVLVKVARYRPGVLLDPVDTVIYAGKRSYRSDVFRFMAKEMEDGVRAAFPDPSRLTVIPIPRSGAAFAELGYDHAEQIAKRLAKSLGCEYMSPLRSLAKRKQKGLGAAERKKNAAFGLKRRHPADLSGRKILLVDDVVTTGATVFAAKEALRRIGGSGISAACFGIAYDDKKWR